MALGLYVGSGGVGGGVGRDSADIRSAGCLPSGQVGSCVPVRSSGSVPSDQEWVFEAS